MLKFHKTGKYQKNLQLKEMCENRLYIYKQTNPYTGGATNNIITSESTSKGYYNYFKQ